MGYARIADKVRRRGRLFGEGSGVWLRETASESGVICQTCGPLEPDLRGWTSDWLSLVQVARDHARETGHQVAAESWLAAIYGPKENELARDRELEP